MSIELETQTAELAKRTAKMATLVVYGKIITLIIQTIMFILVARLLNPSGYGIYTLILSVSMFIASFAYLNIGTYFNERIPFYLARKAYKEIKTSLGDGIVAMIIPGIILSVIGTAASGIISAYVLHSSIYTPLVILSMTSITFYFLFSSFLLILISFSDGRNNIIGTVLYAAVQGVASVLLVLLGFGVAGAIIGYILALVVGSLFFIYVTYKRFGILFIRKDMFKRIRDMLRFSMPLTYTNIISTMVNNFSVILLGLFVLPGLVGNYGIANKVGTIMDVVVGSLSMVLIPTFAETIHRKGLGAKTGKFFYYAIYFGILFTTPMIVYVSVFSKDFIITVFSGEYSGAVLYMQLIAVGTLLSIFGNYATQLAISKGNTQKVFKYSLIVGIVELISLFALIPTFHVLGLIVSLFFIGGLLTNALFINYLRETGIHIKLGPILKTLAANILLAVLVSLLLLLNLSPSIATFPFSSEIILVAGVFLILFIYPPLVAKLGAITKAEIKMLNEIGGDIPILGAALKVLLTYALRFI